MEKLAGVKKQAARAITSIYRPSSPRRLVKSADLLRYTLGGLTMAGLLGGCNPAPANETVPTPVPTIVPTPTTELVAPPLDDFYITGANKILNYLAPEGNDNNPQTPHDLLLNERGELVGRTTLIFNTTNTEGVIVSQFREDIFDLNLPGNFEGGRIRLIVDQEGRATGVLETTGTLNVTNQDTGESTIYEAVMAA